MQEISKWSLRDKARLGVIAFTLVIVLFYVLKWIIY